MPPPHPQVSMYFIHSQRLREVWYRAFRFDRVPSRRIRWYMLSSLTCLNPASVGADFSVFTCYMLVKGDVLQIKLFLAS